LAQKWSKTTAKEQKGQANVLLAAGAEQKALTTIRTMKNITLGSVADRLQCNLSLARRLIRIVAKEKGIKPLVVSNAFTLYTRLPAAEAEAKAQEDAKATAGKKQQPQKKGKQATQDADA
jgi:ribosomal protein S25